MIANSKVYPGSLGVRGSIPLNCTKKSKKVAVCQPFSIFR